MIRLNRKSRIVRWAYPFPVRYWDIPAHTNLCTLFWRSVLLTPMKFLLIVGAVFGLFLPGYMAIGSWKGIFLGPLALALPRLVIYLLVYLSDNVSRRKPSKITMLIRAGYRGFKGKYCPTIVIVRGDKA